MSRYLSTSSLIIKRKTNQGCSVHARLNIEVKIWSDYRFQNFMLEVGGRPLAKGYVIELWGLAQTYWIPDKNLIPEEEWKKSGLPESLISCGLAERRQEGIYAKGSEKHFSWWFDGIEQRSNAGKKSAQRPRDDKGRLLPTRSNGPLDDAGSPLGNNTRQVSNESPTRSNEIQPSSSSSSSSSLKKKNKEKEINAVAVAPASVHEIQSLPKKSKFSEETRKKMYGFLKAYTTRWKEKYGGNPEGVRDNALIGKLGHWVGGIGEYRAISLVEVYLQISFKPFDDTYHDLWQFFRHLNRIGNALDTGKESPTTDWSQVFGASA